MKKQWVAIGICCLLLSEVTMAGKKDSLKTYRAKRNFAKTPEPKSTKGTKKSTKKLVFVVHKHDASHLHYDVRLQVGRVLKSWAVPKGPSTNPAEKHLAVQTEDHPLSYARFEGVIPEGNYGAGSVMVWDLGTYRNIKQKDGKLVPMNECLKRGSVEVWLEGKKLKGGYGLFRTQFGGKKNNWLMIKLKDQYATKRGSITKSQPDSALTNRSSKEIEQGG